MERCVSKLSRQQIGRGRVNEIDNVIENGSINYLDRTPLMRIEKFLTDHTHIMDAEIGWWNLSVNLVSREFKIWSNVSCLPFISRSEIPSDGLRITSERTKTIPNILGMPMMNFFRLTTTYFRWNKAHQRKATSWGEQWWRELLDASESVDQRTFARIELSRFSHIRWWLSQGLIAASLEWKSILLIVLDPVGQQSPKQTTIFSYYYMIPLKTWLFSRSPS